MGRHFDVWSKTPWCFWGNAEAFLKNAVEFLKTNESGSRYAAFGHGVVKLSTSFPCGRCGRRFYYICHSLVLIYSGLRCCCRCGSSVGIFYARMKKGLV